MVTTILLPSSRRGRHTRIRKCERIHGDIRTEQFLLKNVDSSFPRQMCQSATWHDCIRGAPRPLHTHSQGARRQHNRTKNQSRHQVLHLVTPWNSMRVCLVRLASSTHLHKGVTIFHYFPFCGSHQEREVVLSGKTKRNNTRTHPPLLFPSRLLSPSKISQEI